MDYSRLELKKFLLLSTLSSSNKDSNDPYSKGIIPVEYLNTRYGSISFPCLIGCKKEERKYSINGKRKGLITRNRDNINQNTMKDILTKLDIGFIEEYPIIISRADIWNNYCDLLNIPLDDSFRNKRVIFVDFMCPGRIVVEADSNMYHKDHNKDIVRDMYLNFIYSITVKRYYPLELSDIVLNNVDILKFKFKDLIEFTSTKKNYESSISLSFSLSYDSAFAKTEIEGEDFNEKFKIFINNSEDLCNKFLGLILLILIKIRDFGEDFKEYLRIDQDNLINFIINRDSLTNIFIAKSSEDDDIKEVAEDLIREDLIDYINSNFIETSEELRDNYKKLLNFLYPKNDIMLDFINYFINKK